MAVTALYTAATGMQAMSTKIDVIANNLANSDTVGYKASRANFQDLLYQIYDLPGAQTSSETTAPLGTQIGLGTTLANTQILFQQGSAQQTGRSLDVMIQGDGFFRVEHVELLAFVEVGADEGVAALDVVREVGQGPLVVKQDEVLLALEDL